MEMPVGVYEMGLVCCVREIWRQRCKAEQLCSSAGELAARGQVRIEMESQATAGTRGTELIQQGRNAGQVIHHGSLFSAGPALDQLPFRQRRYWPTQDTRQLTNTSDGPILSWKRAG